METRDSAPSKRAYSLRRGVAHVLGFLLVLVAGATLTAYWGRFHFLFDLAAHFRPVYLIGATGLTALLLVLRSWRWALLGAVVAVINLGVVGPYYWPHESPDTDSNLRVLVSNVLTANAQHDLLCSLIRSKRPDVIALIEVNDSWIQSLSAIEGDYPYKAVEARDDNFGIAVYSRHPFTNQRIFLLDEPDAPAISVQLEVAGRPLTFLAMHSRLPGNARMTKARDAQLRKAAKIARDSQGLFIACGDFNTTPWSAIFKDTLARSGLKDARRGFGIQGTWPVRYNPCVLPIDHCLVSPEIGVRSFQRLPSIGSDHFPVLIELVVSPNRKEPEGHGPT